MVHLGGLDTGEVTDQRKIKLYEASVDQYLYVTANYAD